MFTSEAYQERHSTSLAEPPKEYPMRRCANFDLVFHELRYETFGFQHSILVLFRVESKRVDIEPARFDVVKPFPNIRNDRLYHDDIEMPILAVTGRTWLVVVSTMRDTLDYWPREVTHEWGRIHLTWSSPLSLRSMSATGFQPLPVSPRPWTITISYSGCHSGIEHWVDRLMTPTWMKMTVAVCFEMAGRSKCPRGYEVICGDRIW